MNQNRIILFFVNFLWSFNLFFAQAQKISIAHIEEALKQSQENFARFDFTKSISFASQANLDAQNINYDEGIVKSNIYLAKNLLEIGAYNEALKCLKKGSSNKSYGSNIILQVEIHRIKGRIYRMLKFEEAAIAEFRKQLILSEEIADPAKKKLSKFWAHQNLSHVYSETKQSDSAWVHLKEQQELLKNEPEQSNFYNLSTTNVQMAEQLIEKGKYEEAQTLLDESMRLLQKYEAPYFFQTYNQLGKLEEKKGNWTEAAEYYRQGLSNTITLKDKGAELEFYDILADFYFDHHLNRDEAISFLKQNKVLKDSLERLNAYALNNGLKQLLADKEKVMSKKTSSFWSIVVVTAGILLLLSLLFFFRYKRTKKILKMKDLLLEEKEVQHEKLEKEVEENKFAELIEAAKSNDPHFLVLFKELYPRFITALKIQDANIKSSEFSFLAMAYLNFSTKDIAEYTFVTIRAVQVRKNRMRKKYQIPSEVDFNSWIRKLETSI